MEEGKDIAWKPILACIGTGIAGIAIGVFLLAPLVEKAKEKRTASLKEGAKKS